MELIFNLQKLFLETLADLEFKLYGFSPNNLQKWRSRHLKHMNVVFGEKFHMGQNIHIRNRGNLTLGNRCGIGSFAKIWSYAPINIGEDFLAAAGLTLNSATHDPVTLQPQGREINIGSRVWCGINVTIIAGVTIGDDVVIGAGSVVVTDIPSRCIIGGIPAKKIRDLDRANIEVWSIFGDQHNSSMKETQLMKKLKSLFKNFLNSIGLDLVRYQTTSFFPIDFNETDIDIIKKVQPFTRTSSERIYALSNAIRYIVNNQIPGDIVECGVWKGGSMMAAMLTLIDLGKADQNIYLFDTFEGMTEPSKKDISIEGKIALNVFTEKQENEEKWECSSLNEVKSAVYSTGYNQEKIHFVKGKVEDTLPKFAPECISLLRLDTDWYESTRHELIHLFSRISKGGVIIIDDYGHWKGAREAVDEYIQENNIKILLNRIDYTGRIGIKI